ncbi:MAG: class I SAM-dependent methyltransferase [Deltaproteobacteria bacterium]|nr:class I SAM-dependent methyltransferase [Deltaproteobacteria bacterium]
MSPRPEDIREFFEKRVDEYDEHMAETVDDYEKFYAALADPIKKTGEKITILDLGAGTGIELEYIFIKAPHARITAVDLSMSMLSRLLEKYKRYERRIKIVEASYLTMELGPRAYDYAVSVMSLHHLLPEEKTAIYAKIREALKPGGSYIEGDYIVSEEEEGRLIEEYRTLKEDFTLPEDGLYHIDIPSSEKTQMTALREAGFKEIQVLFRTDRSDIIAARK